MAEELRVVTAVATAGIVVRPWTQYVKRYWSDNRLVSPTWSATRGYPSAYTPPAGPIAYTDVTAIIDRATGTASYIYDKKTQPEAWVAARECYLIKPLWSAVNPVVATLNADLSADQDTVSSYKLPHFTATPVRLTTASGPIVLPPESPVVVGASWAGGENICVMSAHAPVPRHFRKKTLYLFCVPVNEALYKGEFI
jgi:hypothetical protein